MTDAHNSDNLENRTVLSIFLILFELVFPQNEVITTNQHTP